MYLKIYDLQKAVEAEISMENTNDYQVTSSLIKREFHRLESTGKRTPNLENLYKTLKTADKATSTENRRMSSVSRSIVYETRNRLSIESVHTF